MDWNTMFGVLYWISMILLGGLALWYKSSAGLKGMSASLVAQAELIYQDSTNAGGKKFEWVISQLYEVLPLPLRMVFTREMLARLVQTTFDSVEAYALLRLTRISDNVTGGKEE